MENKNYFWRPVSEYTGGRVLATNGLDVIIGEINSEGDCESEEDGNTILCGITGFIKIKEMLPELQESEDERIRKLLVEAVTQVLQDQYCSNRGVSKENVIAWLEKRGEQKPTIEMKTPEESLGVDSDTYNKIVDECIYGEQKPAEWSEEDEQLYNDLSDTYFYNDEDYPEETYKRMLKRVLDWMNKRAKSLKPQNTWKPSDEQMRTLEHYMHTLICTKHKEILFGLYSDLKKLREE